MACSVRGKEPDFAALFRSSAANPKFARFRGKCVCELRVQSGTRIIELLVFLDSEVRIRTCCESVRTSESEHEPDSEYFSSAPRTYCLDSGTIADTTSE